MGSLTSFTMSRTNSDFGNVEVRVRNETPRLVLGANGTLGGVWKWDAHIGWSENRYVGDVANNRINQNLSFATDAVVSNGRAVCRATLAGAGFNAAAAGCVPINLFGNGSPSVEALAYVTATSRQTADYSQRVAAANLTGEPFSIWAGPVSVALGAEYRRETIDVRADAISNAGGYGSANAATYSGAFDVKEAYVEVIAPVLRDLPGARALDLNGAVRIADYSSSGTRPTWKVGAVWTPLNGVRVRIARSRDIRAPQIHELSNPGNVTFQSVTINGVSASSIPQNSTRGDPDLDVEKADTFIGGVVVEPSFVRGLSLSADISTFDLTTRSPTSPAPPRRHGATRAAPSSARCSPTPATSRPRIMHPIWMPQASPSRASTFRRGSGFGSAGTADGSTCRLTAPTYSIIWTIPASTHRSSNWQETMHGPDCGRRW